MDEFALTARGRKQLERTLHRTCDARVYRRTLAILEVGRGESVADVARMLGVSRQSVYNWLAEFVRASVLSVWWMIHARVVRLCGPSSGKHG